MTVFCKNKADVAAYVDEVLQNSEHDYVLTMTITPLKSEDYYAHIAIGESLDDSGETMGGYVYSPKPLHTLRGLTPDG